MGLNAIQSVCYNFVCCWSCSGFNVSTIRRTALCSEKGVEHSLYKEGSCYIYCNGINSTDSTLLCSPGPAGQPTSS